MLSVILAMMVGAVVGHWLGNQATPKPATLKVRVGDLRRRAHGQR